MTQPLPPTCARCGDFLPQGSPAGVHCAACQGRNGKLPHLPMLALFTGVHGLALVGMGLWSGVVWIWVGADVSGRGEDLPPWLVLGLLGFYSVLLMGSGVAQIVAALRLRHLKGRRFAMMAWGGGLFSILTCYCLPTSIALMIWGLLVMRDPEVEDAFAHPEEHQTPLPL